MRKINHSSRFIEMFGDTLKNTKDWEFSRLPEVTTIVLGTTPSSSNPDYWDGDIKWITPAELDDDSFVLTDSERHITEEGVKNAGLKSFPAGTVIFSTRAPIGKTAIAGCEMYCNQGFKNFICSDALNPVYLFYTLRVHKEDLQKMGTGSTFLELSKKTIENISVSVPDRSLQDEFEVIYKQADKSKFSDFKSRFIEEFQGKGYKSQKLNSFAQVVTGSTPSRSVSDYWLNGAHPWVSAQDMGDKFVDATAELVSDSGMATCKLIPAGSLLYVCRGSIGVMSINRIDCATNQSICSAICDDSICKTEYLYYWLLYHEDEINSLGEGTSFKSLSQKTFASLKIQIPPIEEQLRFIAITRQADKSKYLN